MNNIEQIINDLCEFDPKLKEKSPELKKIISEILKSKPDTKFDEAFKKHLYQRLMAKVPEPQNKSNFLTSFFMKPFPSLLSGLALGAIVMFTATQYLPLYTQPVAAPELADSNDSTVASYGERDLIINNIKPESFGTLNINGSSVRGQGGGGGGDAVANQESKMMIAPDGPYVPPTQYQYNYNGELSLPDGPVEVLKRIRGKELLKDIPSGIQQIAGNIIDLSGLNNIKLNSLDLLQDSKNGFTINVNFSEGMVSVFKQYEYRPYIEGQEYPKFSLPTDESLFSMANDFLKKYNVRLETYGSPEINKFWVQYPENQIPQQITVIYPLQINGKPVYDQSGSKYGINVNIDLAAKEVVSVWNIRDNQFDSSSYPSVTEKEKILTLAKKGGMFQDWYNGEEKKEPVDLELGAPEEAYLYFNKFDEKTGQSDEILVPALIFPVITEHKDSIYPPRQKVVVPLAKEILEEMVRQPDFQIMRSE